MEGRAGAGYVRPMDDFSLQGRVAIVTGSGRGIGAEIARTLARAGAAVAVTARTQSEVEAVAEEIEAQGRYDR